MNGLTEEQQYRRYIAALGAACAFIAGQAPEECTPDPLSATLEELRAWQELFDPEDDILYLKTLPEPGAIEVLFAEETKHLIEPEDRRAVVQQMSKDLATFDMRARATGWPI